MNKLKLTFLITLLYFAHIGMSSGQNVGIGTNNPKAKLEIHSTDQDTALLVEYLGSYQFGKAIIGKAINPDATNSSGGIFQSMGASGTGVVGRASNYSAGISYGGLFQSSGSLGRGVYGEAVSSTATKSYGGYFLSSGSEGVGVYGSAILVNTTKSYGGYFESQGTEGVGVYGSGVIGGQFDGDFVVNDSLLFGDKDLERVGIGTTSPEAIMHISSLDRDIGGLKVELNTSEGGISSNRAAEFINNHQLGTGVYASASDGTGGYFVSEGVEDENAGIVAIGDKAGIFQGNVETHGNMELFMSGTANTDGLRIENVNPTFADGDEWWNMHVQAGDGDLLFVSGNDPLNGDIKVTFQDDGDVGIGTTDPSEKLEVMGNVKANNVAVPSDLSYKTNVSRIENTLVLLREINGYRYNYRTEEFPEKNFDSETKIGVIAQEIEKVFPELVSTDQKGYKSVSYSNFTAVLLQAIKEQQELIEALQEKNNALHDQNQSFESRLAKLETLMESSVK